MIGNMFAKELLALLDASKFADEVHRSATVDLIGMGTLAHLPCRALRR